MTAALSKTTLDPQAAAIVLQVLNDVTDEHLRRLEGEAHLKALGDFTAMPKPAFDISVPGCRPSDPWHLTRRHLVSACASILQEIELGDIAAEGGAE